jgi:hypothetical protein
MGKSVKLGLSPQEKERSNWINFFMLQSQYLNGNLKP